MKIELNTNKKLNSAEQAKLWATYMGNSMASCVLSHMLHHVEDQEIKKVVENALILTEQFVQGVKDLFIQEHYPLPIGFTQDDVNVRAPRLFADEFYLYYLRYTSKAALSIYGIALPLMTRPDIRVFFTQCLNSTTKLINQVNEMLSKKGFVAEAPYIPYPSQVDFIKKQSYLNGFLGDVRPLQALEITHLFDNIENNAISKCILIGFSQVAQLDQAKSFFLRGKQIAAKHYDICSKMLEKENLSSPSILDPLVTTSTIPPFSDKLMLAHKLDMFSMRIRGYGNALAFSARHDVTAAYGRLLLEVGNYVEDGANILIDHGWLEQPPQAADREALASVGRHE
ncbi:DUF3231 family protein [Paenibacillus ehimensis]|uniref:DUF3231 family protein n=1 Tax=Paenibacillus ehimensis TaxID=79264 RepID=UPI000AF3BFC6|nr:DUF3231 family protein [Paenibacillus ehimensis]MEC0210687.1 DUF3231 family protein [Paenibacillus ehimensis]